MDTNIEKNIKTEQQKSSFKYLSPSNIKLQRTYELFPYNVGYGQEDVSLTSFFTAFSLTAGTGDYGGIQRKFYENQSITADGTTGAIIPSARAISNVGTTSASTILTFLVNGLLSKDGLNNLNSEKNILMNFSAGVYDVSLSSTISWGLNDGRNINYILYDKKTSSTAGDMIMRILDPDPNGELVLSGSVSGIFTQISDLVVGKVFYDYGLVVIDSWNLRQLTVWTLSGTEFRYHIPYPFGNFVESFFHTKFNLTAGTIPFVAQNFNGFVFNRPASASDSSVYDTGTYGDSAYLDSAALSGFYTSIYDVNASLHLNNIEFNSVLNKNTYILEVPILNKDFNYSTNRTRLGNDDNSIPEATEENPLWFNKIGFYDYKNNLLGVAKLNIPIKNSNKRTMIIKIKVDY